jgi:excisionase family DNA binding protein
MSDRLLTIPQAAELLALAPATLRKWIVQRRIPSVTVGRARRLRLLDVEALVRIGSQLARDRAKS